MKGRRTSWRGAVLVLLSLGIGLGSGCDAGPGDPEDMPAADDVAGDSATALALGRLGGGRVFTPYEPGEVVEIHEGIQGGFHVFVDGILDGEALDAECLVTLRMFRVDDGSEVTTIQHLREPDLRRDADGRQTLEQLIVFIPDPDAVYEADVRVEAELAFDEQSLEGDEVRLHLRRADG